MTDTVASKSVGTEGTQAQVRTLLKEAHLAVKHSDYKLALEKLESVFAKDTKNLAAHRLTGQVFLALDKNHKTALSHLQVVAAVNPKDVHLQNEMGVLHRKLNQHNEAKDCFLKALAVDSDDSRAFLNLIGTYRALHQPQQALSLADEFLAKHPDSGEGGLERVECLVALQKNQEALAFIESWLDGKRISPRLLDLWRKLMWDFHREEELVEKLALVVKNNPKQPGTLQAYAQTLLRMGRLDEAEEAYQKLDRLAPNVADTYYSLGVIQRFRGNIDTSKKWIARSLELDSRDPQALRLHGMEHKYVYGDEAFSRLNTAAAFMGNFSHKDKVQIHYALAKAFDDVKEFDSAFAHYGEGGRLKLELDPYDEASHAILYKVMRQLSPELMGDNSPEGCPERQPVFVLGMPRSGTSLLEQVLSSHPEIYGAGELKLVNKVIQGIQIGKVRIDLQTAGFFPKENQITLFERGQKYASELANLAPPNTARIVDKMPGNHLYVGLICSILPNAYIIHSRRHPVETCLSCYRLLFTEGHQWSYNMRTLGRVYKRYWDLMKHWRETFPGRMLEVRYEDMVGNLEKQARNIIDYLELPWNESCLDFHQNKRTVRTASASQVKQPIYNTSVNRWREYEAQLAPLLDEIGDLVEAYEGELESNEEALSTG